MIWLELGGREAKPFPHFPAERLGAWLRAGFIWVWKSRLRSAFLFPNIYYSVQLVPNEESKIRMSLTPVNPS